MRVATALAIHFAVTDAYLFAPDQLTYHAIGRFLADQWNADIPMPQSQVLPNGPKGYFYIVGAIYYVFGPYDLIPKLLNCFVGALTIPAVYDLALRMGASRIAAFRGATYATWFPSLILWSALNIRDAWIILLIVLICRAALAVQARPTLGAFLVLGEGSSPSFSFVPTCFSPWPDLSWSRSSPRGAGTFSAT